MEQSKASAAARKRGPTWLVTFATFHRRPVFGNLELLQHCSEALREASERNGYRVSALAIMPDHVHLVLDAGGSGHAAWKVMNNLKGVAARRVFQAAPELKMDMHSEHLWADEYQAKQLPNSLAVQAACRYVARNPLEIGLPEQRYGWLEVSAGPALQGGGLTR